MGELLDKINSIPFEPGYELAMKPFVLPMSLEEFRECFMDEGAPYFVTKLLKAPPLDNRFEYITEWAPIDYSKDKESVQKVFG